jgi:hypothetical protein
MSLSESPRPQTTLPSASGTVAENPKLEKAIQAACQTLKVVFNAEYDDDRFKSDLGVAWHKIHGAILQAGDLKLKSRLRNQSEFDAYVATGRNGGELIKLLRSTAKGEHWNKLFENGTLPSFL